MPKETQKIIIYKTKTGPQLDVSLEKDTVWLSQKQIAVLFDKDVRTVNEHIGNVYKIGELKKNSTIRKFRIVQTEGKRQVERDVDFYNLDMIISVGYRINSVRGTQFRIWATKKLKKYIIDGYAVNQKRIEQLRTEKLTELDKTIKLLQKTIQKKQLKSDEAKGLLKVITDYTSSWLLLQEYDESKLDLKKVSKKKGLRFDYTEARMAVDELKTNLVKKNQATQFFANEHSGGLESIVGNVFQAFGGKDVYPSIEEKAAHLLYFVIKNHPFTDGNKRVGSFLFIWFLMKNNYLFNKKGEKKINENALVAIALLVAESNPKDKYVMIKIVVNLINNK
ncbi:MAG: hypothetical protein COX81_02675 [Candidatus Magasanikbacteria bacterium CG_4_10_14_0_2_um_filter_37_12]|uniref:Fido domain-containing protein n=1 Tax=Candidatus Magasanikbacteria bacterium CG_4_10_14_0_2_um_filter_37_12 TaxID=1974637 RepID=A0A2M7V7T8_9BACT|nr:MAG: hypothetical protein COX81_02675 [Candidatus Magasanikbacteria bacterium CG_4_10_14_0_2_um_filter_37_12]